MKKISAGYQALIEQLELDVMPHYRASYIKMQGQPTIKINGQYEVHEYSKNYLPSSPNNPFTQLEFALKYDGINLEILNCFFKKIDKQSLIDWIKAKPTSKYTRITWFLFEMLRNEKLPIPDSKKIKYVDLLDNKKYFTSDPIKSSRHAVNNNLLGNKFFCPIVRRTRKLEDYIKKKLDLKTQKIVKKYNEDIITRANNYLLTKETMSSYEIEHERPNKQRIAKFIDLIQKIEAFDHLTKEVLIECQNTIVDYRFIDRDYRINQNYVGENINQYLQKIHFISPKPLDLPSLMQGLLNSLERMIESNCHPVIIATAFAFGFVFLHPFEDGNGRLHRFLIHYILHRTKFTPTGVTFPISATILQNIKNYDATLELFSKPLMQKITQYDLDDVGILLVHQETKHYYQYIDFTHMAEYLFKCINETIDIHLSRELNFIVNYDKTKLEIQSIVDMPDRLIDLFIRLVMQNNGTLSPKKRDKHFDFLTNIELTELCTIVNTNMPRHVD